jgi:hypothetical protein
MSRGFPACAVATGRWRAGLAAPAIAVPLIAASALAPSGVTATIQADPVCLPSTAQPGHSYPLTIFIDGSTPMTLAVGPAHGSLERELGQVPSSWVTFASNPGSGYVGLRLNIPSDAAPGPYWSDITGTTQTSGGAGVRTGTAGTTALVFTIGPSKTPPPPCDALDLAQSTGKFPPWPTREYATTSMQQALDRDDPPVSKATEWPTADPVYPGSTQAAGNRPSPEPAGQHAPASPAANQAPSGSPKIPSSWPGWLAIAVIILLALAALRKRSRS